jgi:hypothetical protein
MEDGNLAILVDAKTEYTKQLVGILAPYIYSGIKKIYFEAKEECFESDTMENTLSLFQKKLSKIPKWNQEIIDQEYENIVVGTKCDWLEDLIMAVFVSHTRILTSINFNKSKNKVNLKIPKVDHFIHQCYIEVARCFWKNPYLFDDTINKYEFQRNRREAEGLIEQQINETIRRQLPVRNILREYLGNDYNEVEDAEEDIESDTTYKNNLRKMVKAEIENCSKEKLEQFSINNEEDETNNGDEAEGSSEENLDTKATEVLENLESNTEPTLETSKENAANSNEEEKNIPTSTSEDTNSTSEESENKESNTEENSSKQDTIEFSSTNSTKDELNLETPTSTLNTNKSISEEVDDGALSDNEIEKKEVSTIIDNEVDKLTLENLDNSLTIEELNFDIDDLSQLEEVYHDKPVIEPINNIIETTSFNDDNSYNDNNKNQPIEENLKLNVSEKNESVLSNNDEIEESPPVKTIIIDTKKGSSKMVSDSNLEINEFEDDEASDSDDESNLRKKVYNKYSKKRDYSFFTDN